MRIAVCDDEKNIQDRIKETIRNWAVKNSLVNVSAETFTSAEGLLLSIEDTEGFDIYLLDLELPKMNGFELAQEIRKADKKVPIVFITNSDDYLLRGYELELCRYIKKPIREEELFSALDKCREKYEESLNDSFVIRTGGTGMKLNYRDVVYIVSDGHGVVYMLKDRPSIRQPIYTNFEKFAEELPEEFFRCHRGFIVNLTQVYSYNAMLIRMMNQEEIPIGRAYRESAVRVLQDWFLNKVLI